MTPDRRQPPGNVASRSFTGKLYTEAKINLTLTLTDVCVRSEPEQLFLFFSFFFFLHLHKLARSRIGAPSACWKFFRLAGVGRLRRVDDVRGLNRDQVFFSLFARRRFTGENQTSFSDSSLTLISVSAAHYRVPPPHPHSLSSRRPAPDMTIHHGDLRRRRRGRRNFCLAAGGGGSRRIIEA